MHFQGKALALLDWHWGKMQTEQTPRSRRRGYSIEHGAVVDDPGADATVRSTSMSALSMEPVVIPPPRSRLTDSSSHKHSQRSPHGELAQTPMGLALRRYFASDQPMNVGAPLQTLDPEDGTQQQEEESTGNDSQQKTEGQAESDASVGSSRTESSEGEASACQHEESANVNSSSASALQIGVVKTSCKTQAGRAMFVKCLNRQRSLETKVSDQASFDELVDCFNAFLDECIREDDIKAAKTAMILAETFYLPKVGKIERSEGENGRHDQHLHHHGTVDRGATRMYLQEEVKKHAIWKNPSVRFLLLVRRPTSVHLSAVNSPNHLFLLLLFAI